MARDPPSYDSGIPLSEADAKTMMDKIEARSKWLKANGKAPPYLGKHQRVILARAKSKEGESETELIRIWTKMERAAHKMCPSSRDHTKLKAAFQQYKDANTNWKDILLAYRADKIKEWNQDHEVIKDHRSGEDDSGGGEEPSMSIRRLYENVIEWQSQRCTNSIPSRHFFADDEERRLARRLSYALRSSRRPKLTEVDNSLLNIIPGILGRAPKGRQNGV